MKSLSSQDSSCGPSLNAPHMLVCDWRGRLCTVPCYWRVAQKHQTDASVSWENTMYSVLGRENDKEELHGFCTASSGEAKVTGMLGLLLLSLPVSFGKTKILFQPRHHHTQLNIFQIH
ncbi:unnamed protein product [Caretta caretta]